MDKEEHHLEDKIAGHLASSWLPKGTIKKIILFVFLILAFKYFMQSEYLLMILMLIFMSIFSPRIMGETVNFLGKMSRKFSK